jgi:mannose-6-phosphate isomerase-like protein (cupin superfamily)
MPTYELVTAVASPDVEATRPETPPGPVFLTVQDAVKVIYSEDTAPTCGARIIHPTNPKTPDAKLGLSVLYVPPGCRMDIHDHVAEEVYIIASGTGEMLYADGSQPVSVGDYIYLPPWCLHGIVNTGREMLTVILALTPPNP